MIFPQNVGVSTTACHLGDQKTQHKLICPTKTETQCFYISKGLQKPNRVPVHQFISCHQPLKDYFDIMPCLYYSDHATKLTAVVKPFDDAALASNIL